MTSKKIYLFLLIILYWQFNLTQAFAFNQVESDSAMKKETVQIRQWHVSDPLFANLPYLHDHKEKGFKLKDLLDFELIRIEKLNPSEKNSFEWFENQKFLWNETTINSTDSLTITPLPADTTTPQIAYLSVNLRASRWMKIQLKIKSCQLLKVYLDGEVKITKDKAEKSSKSDKLKKPGEASGELKLETGSHQLLIKTIYDPASKSPWSIQAFFEIEKDFVKTDLEVSLTPERIFSINDLLDGPKINRADISSDGELVAVWFSQSKPPKDDSESWLEIRKFEDGSLVYTFRGSMRVSGFQWAPTGKRFSCVSQSDGESTLWIVDLEKGTTLPLLEQIKDFGGHTWAPDGQYILYSTTEKPEADKRGVKQLQGLTDRWSYGRNRSFLYQVSLADGVKRRLTAGELSTDLTAIHPNGSSFLFTRTVEDFQNRPYSKTELYHFDFNKFEAKLIWTGHFLNQVSWSPDGQRFLVLAGPSTFGKLGVNVPKGMIPNDYDTQAYLFDTELKNGEAISLNFDPSINSAIWSEFDGQIYFNTTDREFRRIYQYHPEKKIFTQLKTSVEIVNSFAIARTAPRMVFTGQGACQPEVVYTMDLPEQKIRLLVDQERENLKSIKFGAIESWQFMNQRKVTIDGRIYFPPNFNSQQKYPCIVYYYGGTSPVSRNFGGRYPMEFYAAQGYVVYVLQPSGATGFGQAFSALHVNDWGKIVADEIIDGVKQFLKVHPFVDAKRVGCMGASFGGFMTQLLLTRTDIFAAAVSHAGISALSSYWGEGYWGYTYSAVATANSFPWNRKDIYVNQSPLFAADKIVTPLLLTHGASDTNVPPGESEQMYVALKLLGKPVEYLKFDGQNHFIADYGKRKLWTRSIIAWFDKWLKDQPQYWDELYVPAKK